MTADEYVPSEGAVKLAWADRRLFLDSMGECDPSPDAVYNAEFDRFLARVRRDAWQEGYDQGAEDGITSEQMQVEIGLGGIARPARTNPYEETP